MYNTHDTQTAMRARAAFLAGTLCFRSVSTVTLANKYAPLFSLETHSRGHVILEPGKVAERIFFIEEGECQVSAKIRPNDPFLRRISNRARKQQWESWGRMDKTTKRWLRNAVFASWVRRWSRRREMPSVCRRIRSPAGR